MNFAPRSAVLLLAVLIGSASCQLQYDDLSVLGEVVEGSGVEVEKTVSSTTGAAPSTTGSSTTTVAAETTTEAPTTTEAVTTTTTEATTTVAATTEAETTTTTVESTTTTTEATTTTTEATTTTTTPKPTTEEATTSSVVIPETTETEEVDEESFLGFKKPDLATIYRRLFPFQHHPGHKQGQYRQGQFGQQGGF